MKKYKMFFDLEKEEKWLNEQLQKGYRCTNINLLGIYTFEKTDTSYVMRLDYQDSLSKERFAEYQGMYEDFGWSCIKEARSVGIQYWQKEEDGHNEIYSDRESKSHYYKRLMKYTSSSFILLLIFCYMIYDDSSLYLTEGLWDMEGALFWKAFIFETPFAFLRSLPALMAVFFCISFYKAYRNYSTLKEK